MTEYKIIYRSKDNRYQTIDKIFSEESAYLILAMLVKAGYKDARVETEDL